MTSTGAWVPLRAFTIAPPQLSWVWHWINNNVSLIKTVLLCGFLSLTLSTGLQAEATYSNSKFMYQMYCQGCHGPDGAGGSSVPRLKGHMGTFLNTPAGRAYLSQVPGAATSPLNDAQLAMVLNWMIIEFGESSAPTDFEPYTASEVATLRQNPLNEVERYRQAILEEIALSVKTENQ